MEKIKHIPLRMCAGCRNMHEKPKLIRIILDGDKPCIDFRQNKCTRGMYLCKDEKCVRIAQKKKIISKLVKNQVSDDFYEELIEYAAR